MRFKKINKLTFIYYYLFIFEQNLNRFVRLKEFFIMILNCCEGDSLKRVWQQQIWFITDSSLCHYIVLYFKAFTSNLKKTTKTVFIKYIRTNIIDQNEKHTVFYLFFDLFCHVYLLKKKKQAIDALIRHTYSDICVSNHDYTWNIRFKKKKKTNLILCIIYNL